MDWSVIINHGLVTGVIFSALMTVLIVISLMINKEIWINDYPKDVQAVYGPISEKGKRQRIVFTILVLAAFIGSIVVSNIQLASALGTDPGFWTVFANTVIMFVVFNLVDVVIIDWLLLIVLWPGLGILPGTENMTASYQDVKMHLTNAVKGFVLAPLFGLLTAGIAMLVMWAGTLL
jgi:hypothetical protein